MAVKPIILWTLPQGPNPWKVAIILEELNLPYEQKVLGMAELKQQPYTDICPNGRVPTVQDPNTGVTIWETGAIILYLVETYDREGKISHTGPEKYQLYTWLAYQISGQGPYFGQASWFQFFHPEKLPSAIERYQKETHRVTGVLDAHLAKQEHPYLVGNKCTYADLAFVVWNDRVPMYMVQAEGGWDEKKYPHYQKWHDNMLARPAVAKVMKEMREEMKKMAAARA